MDGLRNNQGKIPLYSWQKEHANLSAQIQILDEEYQALKTEVDMVNKIRVKVYDVLSEERQEAQPIHKRSQKFER